MNIDRDIKTCRRGFTLIELVIVLVVIAIVTHLAVVEFSRVADKRKIAEADRQLENISAAVFRVDENGSCAGFLADMGRLPRPVDIDGDGRILQSSPTNGTLAELWITPPSVKEYAIRQAVRSNLRVPDEEKGELEDENVWVPTGWRGPYLRLPVSKSRLYDPWGNAMEEHDSALLRRLWVTNGFVVAASHYGERAQSDGRRDMALVRGWRPGSEEGCRLVVYVDVAEGVAAIDECVWYGPSDGMVTGKVESVASNVAVCNVATPGMKVVALRRGGSSVVVRPVEVPPGGKEIRMVVVK